MSSLVLSTSSVSTYLRCPQRWLLSYVYRMKGAGQNVPAAIGQAVHSGVEAYWKGKPATDALRAAWEKEVASVPASDLAADPDALPDAHAMLSAYIESAKFMPTLVEAEFAADIAGVTLTGTIDAADEDVHDTKTTAGKTINGKKPSSFRPERHDLQLSLYAIGYHTLTGKWPRRLLLDVVTRRGAYRQYEREAKVGEALELVAVVRDGIGRGEYPATGALNGSCAWCPFLNNGCRYGKT